MPTHETYRFRRYQPSGLRYWLWLRWAIFRGRARVVRVMTVIGGVAILEDGSTLRFSDARYALMLSTGDRIVLSTPRGKL